MKYKIALLFGLFFFCLLITGIFFRGISQTGLLMSVHGWVKDLETRNPIRGITINLFKFTEDGSSIFISKGTSDQNGFYKIKYLEVGLYHFLIETSDGWIIYIGSISFGGSEEDYYELEIKNGENKNLNIFIGKGASPDIERKEFLDGKRIYFIMILNEREELKATLQATENNKSLKTQQTEQQEYKGLKITNHLDIEEIDEEAVIGEKDLPGEYRYRFEFLIDLRYQDGTCIIMNCKGTLEGRIRINKFNWHKARVNKTQQDKGLPPLSDEIIQCLYGCVKIHEWTHWKLAPEVAKQCWDELLKKLRVHIPATCQGDCDKLKKKLETETFSSFDIRMDETEKAAQGAENDCRKKCK